MSNGACNQPHPWLAELSNLEELDVSNNDDLTELPDSVLGLPRLRKLTCYNSGLVPSLNALRRKYPSIEFAT